MCINPNAEQELRSPKATFNLEVQNIAIEMTKAQVRLGPSQGQGWAPSQTVWPGETVQLAQTVRLKAKRRDREPLCLTLW